MSPLQLAEDDVGEPDGPQTGPIPSSGTDSVSSTPAPLHPMGKSQHTVIEYYTESEEDEDEFDDNSSFNGDETAQQETKSRLLVLQRAESRQSILSVQSDTFSLPMGSQDDVSSLGCDNADDTINRSSAGDGHVDDISLKELKSSFAKSADGIKGSSNTDEKKAPDKDTIGNDAAVSVDSKLKADQRLKAFREIFVNSRKSQVSALHLSTSNLATTMDNVIEAENESSGDDDDNNDEEEDAKSMNFADILDDEDKEQDEDMDDLIARMHKSFFLPRGLKSASEREAPLSPITPKAKTHKRNSLSKTFSPQDANERFYDNWTKNLPPELDLVEARKYLIQLAEGVPITPSTPAKTLQLPTSTTKSTALKSMDSEYTEIVIDDESGTPLNIPRKGCLALHSPNLLGKLQTPPPHRSILPLTSSSLNRTPSGDSMSTEYTEIVIEDTPTPSTRGNNQKRNFFRLRTEVSYDITEIVEYDETEVEEEEEEEIIEEEILDEEDEDELEQFEEVLDASNQ